MNPTPVTYKTLREFHDEIATKHKLINDFYRFDMAEVNNAISDNIQLPALMMEAPSSDMSSETKMVSNFRNIQMSFLIMDHAGAIDDFEKKELILETTETIALDICSFLVSCAKNPQHWLFGKFDVNSLQLEKVGPLFDNMHGWNVLYSLKVHQPMMFDASKWNEIIA